jgi:hypothetical protein
MITEDGVGSHRHACQQTAQTQPGIVGRCSQTVPAVSLVGSGDLCHQREVGRPEKALSHRIEEGHADKHRDIAHDQIAEEPGPLQELSEQHDAPGAKAVNEQTGHRDQGESYRHCDAERQADGW